MKKQRQKQINIDAVIKVQNFLKTAKEFIDKGENFSMTLIASSYRIDRMIATLAVRNGYFEKGVVKGEYIVSENFDMTATGAKKLIELVRLSKVDSNNAKVMNTFMPGGVHSTNSNINGEDVVPKIEALRRRNSDSNNEAIKSIHLFSEKEKEFDDKLKIVCAVASGIFGYSNRERINSMDYEYYNNKIVEISNDLYEKLKNNK